MKKTLLTVGIYNKVHTLLSRQDNYGLEVKLNWRYWGIALSWGDSLAWDGKVKPSPIWFVGCHIGPLFLTHGWPK